MPWSGLSGFDEGVVDEGCVGGTWLCGREDMREVTKRRGLGRGSAMAAQGHQRQSVCNAAASGMLTAVVADR